MITFAENKQDLNIKKRKEILTNENEIMEGN